MARRDDNVCISSFNKMLQVCDKSYDFNTGGIVVGGCTY